MDIRKINVFLSTLSLVLIVIGYPLVTTLFLPSNSDISDISQAVTVPYRVFCLVLMLLVIMINIRKSYGNRPLPLTILIIFWALWIFRMCYDSFVRGDVFITSLSQLWLYVLGICIPALLSMMKTVNVIDTDKALQWIWWGLALILIVTLFSNQALISNTDNEFRVDGNVALNTISYGNIGVTTFILSLFQLLNQTIKSKWKKIFCILICILAFYSLLRAGSRGPLLNLVFLLMFWFFSRRKNIMLGTVAVLIFSSILFFFQDFFLSLLGDIAPIIEQRMRDTINGTADDGRDGIHQAAINLFLESPIIGKQFAIFDKIGDYGYAHNIFLDAIMGLGIIGGVMILYILSSAMRAIFVNIKNNDKHFWIGLILLQQIFSLMLSGAFYQDQIFSALLVFVLLKQKHIF